LATELKRCRHKI